MGCFLSKSQDVKDAAEAPKPKPVTTVKVKPLQSRTKTVGTVKTEGLELSQNEGGELEHFRADVNATPHLRRGVSCLKIIEENSVLVAVRVRPLNEKEKSSRSPSCVDVTSPTSISLSGSSKKEFNFDCVMREDTTQQEVFDRSARPLLHKVLQGYNGCLFAYGQTGSGKTWTMLGEGKAENKGIIPNLCDELFEQVEARKDRQTFTVQCGMLEIYNENLNDLLVRTSAKEDARDLQIFEDKTAGGRGIYVDGLSAMNVDSPSAVLQLIADGQRRRAVGRTNMNEHSSRSVNSSS
uniref:Kinesin motor domain-containing protein n=1 Tax=Chromera velia CCMP2878 TaxID=1169474 RepID=A0A0K6S852_9ALVE|eukprot:Cvel_24037.t1-p1 / transcript=Cvel_24037.t1 / gene=Cvel_24037 / organism=Chromera_velia_CCMP2878 / gene_product=Kinesin-like protein KIF3B, putative / transcript_product=Kinesin-like protein KIF3B, putative / location=Cvel_scaffold2553:18610-19906(+) / protein_length=294 / sequence_SO=supercontig / SO=protein_coding / is_pseudo=false